MLTAKIAVGAATAVAAGGVALAAGAGAVPNPLADPAPQASTGANAAQSARDRAASPSPNLVGLCEAYAKGAADNPGKARQSTAFKALVDAAGGEDKVSDYCDDLLGDRQRGSDHSTGEPAERPADAPGDADHPTSGPGGQPTGAPNDHPTTRPDSTPSHPGATSTGRP